MMEDGKSVLQDAQYDFPYHYLPWFHRGTTPRVHRYLSWGFDYLTYMSFLVDLVSEASPHSLLDVGCGDGRLVSWVKDAVPKCVGVDLSPRAIALARALNPDQEFLCADIANVSGQFQYVTLVEVLEHVPSSEIVQFMHNVRRLTEPDGRLLITVPTVNIPVNDKHYRHYDIETLRHALSGTFEIESSWWLSRQGIRQRLVKALVANPLYVLNAAPLLRLLWKMHKRYDYFGDSSTGAHLVCVARPAKG